MARSPGEEAPALSQPVAALLRADTAGGNLLAEDAGQEIAVVADSELSEGEPASLLGLDLERARVRGRSRGPSLLRRTDPPQVPSAEP